MNFIRSRQQSRFCNRLVSHVTDNEMNFEIIADKADKADKAPNQTNCARNENN